MRPLIRTCIDLQAEIDVLLADGYRLDMIMPADEPRVALVSKGDEQIRLSTGDDLRSEIRDPRSKGRAGMEYRDLIPDRLGGKVIASHIRIAKGGEVPDYVHYHKVCFQMIYCRAGWVRVVYEDQGPPFVMSAGDYVLQPPGIRHRVLESSAGAEVIEVSAPGEHETWVEHELELPTAELKPDRVFAGQRFVLHRGDSATPEDACAINETEIEEATQGLAGVRIVRLSVDANYYPDRAAEFMFLYVLSGKLRLQGSNRELGVDASLVLTQSPDKLSVVALEDSQILEVTLREI